MTISRPGNLFGLAETLHGNLCHGLISLILSGVKGKIPDTPKEGDAIFKNVRNIIVGNNRKAIQAAAVKAQGLGLEVIIDALPRTPTNKIEKYKLKQMILAELGRK